MIKFPANGKGTWCRPQRVGHNPINSFITDLAKSCGLGHKRYSNYSLKVTAISSLTRENFSNKQIMSLTGHKSMSLLAIYQKVSTNEKLRMGFTLGYNLLNNIPALDIWPEPQPLPVIAAKMPKMWYKTNQMLEKRIHLSHFSMKWRIHLMMHLNSI